MSSETQIGKDWSARHLQLAIDAAGIALWSWNVDTDQFAMDAHGYKLWHLPLRPFVMFEHLSAQIHPADRDRVRSAFAATRAIVGPYEIDFRIMVSGDVRWISARGQGNDADIEGRAMFGIFIDVTGRKQAEEAQELLAGEMSHRVKNLLAIASALTVITSRSAVSAEDMARELTERLISLGRAHDLVRPVPGNNKDGALLGDLISVLLAPYDDMAAFSSRIRVAVPRMSVGEAAATSLAMVLHELATNSMKYGALSAAAGTLDVSCHMQDNQVGLVWTERGGPPVSAPVEPDGFGSKLLRRSVSSGLNGSIKHNWSAEGVIITVMIDKERLAR